MRNTCLILVGEKKKRNARKYFNDNDARPFTKGEAKENHISDK